jgi:hypothetical protein
VPASLSCFVNANGEAEKRNQERHGNMTKTDLARGLSDRLGMLNSTAESVVDSVFEISSTHSSKGPSEYLGLRHFRGLGARGARHLEIEAGKPLLHQFSTKCRRNFVCDLGSENGMRCSPEYLTSSI